MLASSSSWPTSFSLLSSHSPPHSRDFSRRLKFMLTRVPGACISRFASRNARFAPGYAHVQSVYTHTQIYVPRYDPVFLSRFSHLAPSLTSLFVSAARDRVSPSSLNGKSTKRKRTRQRDHRWWFLFSGIAVVPLRKTQSAIYRNKNGIKKKREREK